MSGEHEMQVGFPGDNRRVKVQVPDGDLTPWDLGSKLATVGGRSDRVDAIAKVTGKARYAHDINLPGMLSGAILRSPHPRASLRSLDLSEALAMPGVQAVVPLKEPGKRIRYVGDPVAAVAAKSLDQARDALELIVAEYDVEEHHIDLLETQGAPTIVDGDISDPWPEPRPAAGRRDADPDMQRAIDESDLSAQATWTMEVQTHSSLESHGNVVWYKQESGSAEIWASTQATFGTRRALATVLEIPEDKVTVHAEFVGGGFGSKFQPGDEGRAAALLSKAANAPVKLMLDRFEEHTCSGNRPSAIIQIRAGIDADGTVRAWDTRSFGGPGFSGRGGGTRHHRDYFDHAETRQVHQDLQTDTDAGRAMRAPGHPQGKFAMEGMMDMLAAKCGMDPLEFRLHNDKSALRQAEWRLGAKRFGWTERFNQTPGQGQDPRYLQGAGLSSAFWGGMGGGSHRVTCRIHADGRVESRNGAQDIGTGMKTVMAMLTAEELQISTDQVQVTMGDTNDPPGPASGGSTTTPSLSPAVRHAAGLARQELTLKVAERLEVDAQDIVWRKGKIGIEGGTMIPFKDACKLIGNEPIETTGVRQRNYDGYQDNVCGCQFADVRVDRETGVVQVQKLLAVQDCGRVINQKLAESQVIGAMIEGLSYVLHEQRIMDPKQGRMLNGDFLSYKIAGSLDMPELEAIMFSVANGKNNVGAAGLGEPPATATPAAIANAVSNAIGVPMRSMPITPDKVLAALHSNKK